MLPAKLLFRTAGHLRAGWEAHCDLAPPSLSRSLECLRRDYLALQDARNRLVKASRHGLSLILPMLQEELLRSADALQETLRSLLQDRPTRECPSINSLVADLRQLEVEFTEVKVHSKQRALSVTTHSIDLEGIDLGPFAIKLHWDRHADGWSSDRFDIVALEPNPASTDERVTHPHVKDEILCAGDASAAIRKALQEGRLADAFLLVRSVLMTYNRHSPHVSLEAWHGRQCYDCGSCMSEDESRPCDRCDHDFCRECIQECPGCHRYRCADCMGRCLVCKRSFCDKCLRSSAHSGRKCCCSCSGPCRHCRRVIPKDELDNPQGCPAQQPKDNLLLPTEHPDETLVTAGAS